MTPLTAFALAPAALALCWFIILTAWAVRVLWRALCSR